MNTCTMKNINNKRNNNNQ